MAKRKKPFYKRWWFILLAVIIAIGAIGRIGGKNDKKTEYKWPDSELANMIPKPASKYGKVGEDSARSFCTYIYDISDSQFEDYIEECKNRGFTVDYRRLSSDYSAGNENGYSLSLSYDAKKEELSISLHSPADKKDTTKPEDNKKDTNQPNAADNQPEENKENPTPVLTLTPTLTLAPTPTPTPIPTPTLAPTPTSAPTPTPTEENKDDKLVDGMCREFKEAMDSYEAFYNEYFEFMKEYETNPSDFALLTQYLEFMSKTIEMNEKFEAWDEGEMNDAELKYYLEVHARITKKLLEFSTQE